MRQNIYEIQKVHPFIKTLEKVKALRDNLDEHIEITSQLWEDGKSSDAYYYSSEIYHECQKILVNAASLVSCAGNTNAVSDVGKFIKSAVPVEVGYTEEGWFCVRFPALLPKKKALPTTCEIFSILRSATFLGNIQPSGTASV